VLFRSEQSELEAYTFVVNEESADCISLQFDIYPTFGSKVIGRAIVLAQNLGLSGSTSRDIQPGSTKVTCPLFDTHLKVVGHLSFDAFVVKPFIHSCLSIGGKVATYWKATSISNMPAGRFGIVTDSSLANEYVHVVVVVSGDGVPIVHGRFWIDIGGGRVAVTSLTYDQIFKLVGGSNGDFKEGMSVAEVSRIIGNGCLRLKDVLELLPPSMGLSLEVKFPALRERACMNASDTLSTTTTCLNSYLDHVLKVVYDHAQSSRDGGKSLIFTSSNPLVCTAINWKQPNYGVFFKTFAGYSVDEFVDREDERCLSIKEGIKFAKSGNLLGVFCLARPLVKAIEMIKTIKESGLILASFGSENEISENVTLQERYGVDAILTANGVFRYSKEGK